MPQGVEHLGDPRIKMAPHQPDAKKSLPRWGVGLV